MKNLRQFLNRVKYFGIRKLYFALLDAGIINPARQQTLLKQRIIRTLLDEFGADDGHNIGTAGNFIGFGLIHYAFVRNCEPKRILCIGSGKGFIPAVLALACKDNASGHVDFVDAGFGKETPDKHWGGTAFWKSTDPKKHFAKLDVSSYITTHVMDTQTYAKRFPHRLYEYIYIDGDHSYRGVKTDYELFWPLLRSGGFMVFHDIVARGHLDQGTFGVWKFWNELSGARTIMFPFPKHSGLGIVQKP